MTMKLTIKHLFRRGLAWQFRRRVPSDIRSIVGKSEWVVSLGDISQDRALKLVTQHTVKTDREINRARAELAGTLNEDDRDHIHDLAFNRAVQQAGGIVEAAGKFGNDFFAAVNAGLTDREKQLLSNKTSMTAALERDQALYPVGMPKHQEIGFRDFVSVNGDLSIEDVKREHVMAFVLDCRRREMAEATIKRRIGALGAVLKRYDADHDIMRRNPFYGVQLRNAGPTKGDREPLTEAQIAQLDFYLRNATGLLPRTRALLWLVRSSTLGPSEAGGLLPPDIILDHEVPHVIVRANELRGIKVRSRARVSPLVGPVLEFANALPASTFGGNAISALLNKHLRKAISDLSPKQSAYSLRHRMRDRLYQAGATPDEARYLMGHSSNSAHDRYGASRPDLAKLAVLLGKAL